MTRRPKTQSYDRELHEHLPPGVVRDPAFLRRLVRRNAASDVAVLRWRRPVAKDLWSAADGPSVRTYRSFYRRKIRGRAGRRFADAEESTTVA